MGDQQLISVSEAARQLRVSRPVIAGLIGRGQIAAYRDPLNRRVRLVSLAELERLRKPQPEKLIA